LKVALLTTSYPRYEGDAAGHFVGEAVERLRGRGIDVEVVSPLTFRHYGIAYGDGVVGNLRREPLRAALLPAMVASFRRAAARAARDADLVHAHWIPSAIAARATGKPYVLQVWGTDVELAQRLPWLVRPVVRRAEFVIAASAFLTSAAVASSASMPAKPLASKRSASR